MKLPCLNDNIYTQLSLKVETVAQFGVIFLLFALGLEFSVVKVGLVLPKFTRFVIPLCNAKKNKENDNLKEIN